MLLELAIGDAYGAGFEFVDMKIINEQNNFEYIQHPTHKIGMGYYTDDTQMSIAITELIMENSVFSNIDIANKFLECFKRDMRVGYAGGFYKFLLSVNSGEEFLEKIKPDSVKNGSCMRAVPLGIFKDINEVIDKSTKQAKITHNTKEGINSSVVVSLLSHYFIWNKGEKKDVKNFILEHVNGDWDIPHNSYVAGTGEITTRAVITVLMKTSSLKEILFESIKMGGDVDSVACIAMGIASLSDQWIKDIPENLYNNLETSKYGREYLEKLDIELINFKKEMYGE